MSTNETKTRKPRQKRRNFAKELSDLQLYLRIKVDVLKSIDSPGGDLLPAIEVYEDVLARLEAK